MLRSAKSLRDYHIRATDGTMGRVSDFLFDGQEWTVRYAAVDTSEWLPGRIVLLIPDVLGPPDAEEGILPVALTREQVKNSPPVEAGRPVSRQHEADLFEYYGWSPYWGTGRDGWTEHVVRTQQVVEPARPADADLRSVQEILGYSLHAVDGRIGHVEDFLIDDKEWILRYIVADTRNWLPGRKVLICPQWVQRIDWQTRELWFDRSRQDIRGSPLYDPSRPVNRRHEMCLHDYYGRRRYRTQQNDKHGPQRADRGGLRAKH